MKVKGVNDIEELKDLLTRLSTTSGRSQKNTRYEYTNTRRVAFRLAQARPNAAYDSVQRAEIFASCEACFPCVRWIRCWMNGSA